MRLVRNRSIVGGAPLADKADNPFQVALLMASEHEQRTARSSAGGTLVRPNFVVTAAHCSDFVEAERGAQVLTGTQRLNRQRGPAQRRRQITVQSGWNSNTFDNDAAVWELSDRRGRHPARRARDRGRAGGR